MTTGGHANGHVDLSVRNGVATISWANIGERNAMTADMADGIARQLRTAETDRDATVIVLTGSGADFSAGGSVRDLRALADSISSRRPSDTLRVAAMNPQPVDQILHARKPTIAAIDGACAGIGFVIAAACDIRIAAENAILTAAFTRRGLPAEQGIAWLLPRLVGSGAARELLISCRRFDATEALRIGFVSSVVAAGDVADAAQAYGEELAGSCSPAAMALVKEQLDHDAHATMRESRAFAEGLVSAAIRDDDFREGIVSFIERRRPSFQPLQGGPRDPLGGAGQSSSRPLDVELGQ